MKKVFSLSIFFLISCLMVTSTSFANSFYEKNTNEIASRISLPSEFFHNISEKDLKRPFNTNNSIDKTQIQDKFEELMQASTKIISAQIKGENPTTLQSEYSNIEEDLYAMGVKKLTENEVSSLVSTMSGEHSILSNTPGVPSSINNNWYSIGPIYQISGSQTHTIYEIYAAPKGLQSNLASRIDLDLWVETNQTATFLNQLVSIYVQKAISMIKVVEWLPYELLFPNSSPPNLAQSDYEIWGAGSSIMCYSWVQHTSNNSNGSYVLTMATHTATMDVQHNFRGIRPNGQAYSATPVHQVETQYSNHYASVSKAVEHFSNFGAHTMYSVDKFEYRRNNIVQGSYHPPLAYHPAHVN